jgi:hypothetical protein
MTSKSSAGQQGQNKVNMCLTTAPLLYEVKAGDGIILDSRFKSSKLGFKVFFV